MTNHNLNQIETVPFMQIIFVKVEYTLYALPYNMI